MKVHVLTLFPSLFDNFLKESIVGIAQEKGHLQVQFTDYRNYTTDKHHTVDDRPFGGGPGMVIKPEPVFAAVEDVLAQSGRPDMPRILFTPQGRPFDQPTAEWLSTESEWLLLCGRYEGFDQRIHEGMDWLELSLGSFVLSGGEIPAMAVIEAATRLIPGVLGEPQSALQESFAGDLLDHPQYTRPRSFRGMDVPSVLLNGDHDEIAAWRRDQAERRTAAWRSSRNPRT